MRPIQENDVFHAIAHPARRAMLVTLKDGERTAGDLAAPFHMSFAAVSQHLRVLEEAELVSARREGRQRIYRIDPRPMQEIVGWIDEFAVFFGARLDALGEYLDRKHGKKVQIANADAGKTPDRPRGAAPLRGGLRPTQGGGRRRGRRRGA